LYAEAVANIVHVELMDGRTISKRVDYPLGNAKNRLKDSELEGKVTSLIAPALGEPGVKKILTHAWKLDEAKGVTELMQLVEMPD
jgi:2-methylcitrate dehydratase PrpD